MQLVKLEIENLHKDIQEKRIQPLNIWLMDTLSGKYTHIVTNKGNYSCNQMAIEELKKINPHPIFDKIGRQNYIKLPNPETNPRGVEITKETLSSLVGDSEAKSISINWQRTRIEFNSYRRWVDLWREN